MEHSAKILGAALLSLACSSEALTLGRVRGAALVGQPLNMAIQVQMDAGENAASLCFEADVFHADTRQDASRVRVMVEPTAQANQANVRVLSSAIVDEPVVTVYLRTGCGQKTSRRYVLLADMPSEVAAPAVPQGVAASAIPPAPMSATPQPPASIDLPTLPVQSQPFVIARVKKPRPPKLLMPAEVASKSAPEKSAATTPKRPASEEKSKTERSSGQSRLKLDPLEFLSDRVANLEFPVPITPPEETLRNLQRMQTIEESMKALLVSSAKNEARLADLQIRLQQAESERFPATLVYGLIALVLACLAAVVWLWTRQRRAQANAGHWWHDSVIPPAPTEPGPPTEPKIMGKQVSDPLAPEKPEPEPISDFPQDSRLHPAVDVNLMDMSDSFFDDFMLSGAEHNAINKKPSPTLTPKSGQARLLNSEAMQDIRRQAEFFISLGKTEQAARLLKRQVKESTEPNPFIYLDLLSTVHAQNQKADYQKYQRDFQLLFNGTVPEFSSFPDEGRNLESYPAVLSQITSLWHTPKVLEVIEACLFKDAQNSSQKPFDLSAFRDLLLLQTIAYSVTLPMQAIDETKTDATTNSAAQASTPALIDPPQGDVTPASATDPLEELPMEFGLDQVALPSVLDLDLSDSEMMNLDFDLVSAEPVDLPSVPPVDFSAADQSHEAIQQLDGGNLIDFDLPDEPKLPEKRSGLR